MGINKTPTWKLMAEIIPKSRIGKSHFLPEIFVVTLVDSSPEKMASINFLPGSETPD